MFSGFEKIVEQRIRNAQERGDFNNLEGSGRPLSLDDDHLIPEDLRLAYKMLKNADCLPPEIELKKEIQTTETLLAAMPDTAEKHRVVKKLNYLILKLNMTRNSSVRFEVPQKYMGDVITKLERDGA